MKALYNSLFALALILLIVSCGDDEETTPPADNIIPDRFGIDIPDVISNSNNGGKIAADPDSVVDVSFIYMGLPGFIEVGENSAEFVEEIIIGIIQYNLSSAQAFEFVSDDDGRIKTLEVKENVNDGTETWQYGLQIKDTDDNAVALQVFWNNNPVKGYAIASPFEMDRAANDSSEINTLYKVSYSEDIDNYDAEMIVSAAGTPVDPTDTFEINALQMVVRKIGDVVEVYGNSNHPQWEFEDGKSGIVGRNYAFRAKGNEATDVGVAEVAIPPSDLNSVSNLYINFNILEVCKEEYGALIEPFLFNYKAPGYFSEAQGFLGDGDYNADPVLFPTAFVQLDYMTPFVPRDVRDLKLAFVDFDNL